MSVSRSSKQNLADARKKSIDVLNQEIMNLYKKCKSDGYDDHMLKEITYSLAHMAKCAKWKFRVKQLIYFSLVIVVIAGIIQCNATNRILSVAYKKFMVNHVSSELYVCFNCLVCFKQLADVGIFKLFHKSCKLKS